jgi:hypothetical protein
MAVPGLASVRYRWQLHVDNFVAHGVQHQLGGGMKPEFPQDVAAMRFRCFYGYA